MRPLSHSSLLAAGRRSAATRRLVRAFGLTTVLLGALLLAAVPASAVVETVGGRQYGVEPQSSAAAAKPSTPLAYENGPVVHSSAPYAIYWDPADGYAAWEGLTAGFLEEAGSASGSLGNVFSVATQYRDASANAGYSLAFRGSYTDVDPFKSPENCKGDEHCLSDAQIRVELSKYILANGLPGGLNPSTGPTPIYFVFTPPGTTVCLGAGGGAGECSESGICSYHSFTTVNTATVLYAVLPWTAKSTCQDGTGILEEPNLSLADVVVNEIADEQIATVTDPLLTGWHKAKHLSEPLNEVPDMCRNEFLPVAPSPAGKLFNQTIAGANYYINDEFNQAALKDPYPGEPCINKVTVAPRFTTPNSPFHPGDAVTFNATESYVDLGIAKYSWEFGPGETAEVNCEGRTPTNGFEPAECNSNSGTGNPNSVASVVHKYAHSGTYNVKLTVIDDGGNPESVTHSITVLPTQQEEEEKAKAQREVEGKAKREAEEKGKGEAEEKGKGEAEEKGKGEAEEKAKRALSAPMATAGVLSRSLKSVLAKGLVVRYSVNQQVAGRFEVLLAASIARRIGLHGPPATGLPSGTLPEIAIGKAILVTTKGGHGTVKIQLGKVTAAHLRRLRKVSLMVRLVVRNASAKSPATSTVVSVVTLTH